MEIIYVPPLPGVKDGSAEGPFLVNTPFLVNKLFIPVWIFSFPDGNAHSVPDSFAQGFGYDFHRWWKALTA
jgi:hypothetical protein